MAVDVNEVEVLTKNISSKHGVNQSVVENRLDTVASVELSIGVFD